MGSIPEAPVGKSTSYRLVGGSGERRKVRRRWEEATMDGWVGGYEKSQKDNRNKNEGN
jgi:hypothetical protein